MSRLFPLLLLAIAPLSVSNGASLKLLSSLHPGAETSEILSFTRDGHHVACTCSSPEAGQSVIIFTIDATGTLREARRVDLKGGFKDAIYSVSSVALDPLGRGLGAAAVIPKDKAHQTGTVMLFNYRTGSLLGGGLKVGFHPDCVNFSHDGRFLLVANEGEFNSEASTPGSLSVIDLAGLQAADAAAVAGLKAETFDFRACDLTGIRTTETNAPTFEAFEPEYVAGHDGKAFLSLQENNALAIFDLAERKWAAIRPLGTITQTIDANDKDGVADISQQAAGLPMPDTISAFTLKGAVIIATANEGDARSDDGDRVRLGKAKLDPSLSRLAADEKVNRLEISSSDGDTDGDGDIDVPAMFGARSISLWDAATGRRISDTGNLEPALLKHDPALHNIDEGDPATMDCRSGKKGPEPEALAHGRIGGRDFLFAGMERQNGILMMEVTDPEHPAPVAYANTITEKLIAPECAVFVPDDASPTGRPLLLVGYEAGQGGIAVFEVQP